MDFKTAFNIVYGRDPLPSDASKSMYDQGASVIAAAQAIQETTEPSTVDKTSSEEAINQLYLDEFGRPASQEELNYHIDRFGAELDAQESADLTGELIRSVGDTATAEADTTTADTTTADTTTADTKAEGSSEDKVGVTEEGVKRLYENVLLRDPNNITQGELDYYTGKTRADILKGFRSSEEFFGPRAVKQVYQQVVGRAPNAEEVGYHLGNYGANVSSLEKRDLADQLRGEQLDNFNRQLGIAAPLYGAGRIKRQDALDFSNFNKAPTNAGISRLRPIPNYGKNTAENITRLYQAETGRTPNQEEIDFYTGQYGENIDPSEVLQFREAPEAQTFQDRLGGAVIQQPFTAPTDVLQRVAYDPEAEGVGPTMADVFGYEAYNPTTSPEELAAQDRRAADIAAFTGDEAMEGVTPSMIDAGIASVPGLNKGGEVDNMGLQGLGQKMAAYGRYGDTMLAHISPEEAMMLKAMGGSGTRNPVTGLPEFFLKKVFKIFKSILPAAVAVVNPPLGAALAAADAGFKDGKFNLKKAALAGIKTYALSKVGQKISGVEATPTAGDVGMQTIGKDTTPFLKSATAPSIGDQLTQPLTDPGQFASDVGRVGSGFKDAAGEFAQGDFSRLKGTAVPGTVAGLTYSAEAGMKEAEKIKREADALNYDAEKRKKEQERKALAALAPGFGYAQGGISSLAPRYLDGAGDGMSDSIRANIDGQQEARLADGEFVIPADVVADMGNGSSNAGAERLYSMMDRIREARHGTTKQPPEVNVNNMMPA